MKPLQTIKNILCAVITAVLLGLLVLVMYQKITGRVPGLFGYHFMYVLTGSMEPVLHTGDAVLVKDCDPTRLVKDDIVCYTSRNGDLAGKIITHQVVVSPYQTENGFMLQTQGVANSLPDDPISVDQVVGKVVTRLALMGKIYQFFCTVPGLITVCLPIVLMMAGEIRQIIRINREQLAEEVAAAKASVLAQNSKEEQNEEDTDKPI